MYCGLAVLAYGESWTNIRPGPFEICPVFVNAMSLEFASHFLLLQNKKHFFEMSPHYFLFRRICIIGCGRRMNKFLFFKVLHIFNRVVHNIPASAQWSKYTTFCVTAAK